MITTEDIKNIIPQIIDDADDEELAEFAAVLKDAIKTVKKEQATRSGHPDVCDCTGFQHKIDCPHHVISY